uniref:Uncharacterized protein n=1 Tax=Corvus moneduloides TaxID=1196302 RepID=A0A8U7NDU3_CORMO
RLEGAYAATPVLSYLGGVPKVEETDLKPRVGFLYSIVTHNISILINDTQEQDSGQYMCTVNVVDDTIRLEKNVVPPATPTCQLHGNAVVGANVTLSCSSKKGKPSPMYQWQRESPTLQVFFPPAQGKVASVGSLGLEGLSLPINITPQTSPSPTSGGPLLLIFFSISIYQVS